MGESRMNDDAIRLYKEILETLQRLEKAGTLEKFFANVPDKPLPIHIAGGIPFLGGTHDYKDIHDFTLHQAALYLNEAYKTLVIMRGLLTHTKKLYEGWVTYQKDIKNPDILQFLEDYEKAHRE